MILVVRKYLEQLEMPWYTSPTSNQEGKCFVGSASDLLYLCSYFGCHKTSDVIKFLCIRTELNHLVPFSQQRQMPLHGSWELNDRLGAHAFSLT